jgi:hypothetical protein
MATSLIETDELEYVDSLKWKYYTKKANHRQGHQPRKKGERENKKMKGVSLRGMSRKAISFLVFLVHVHSLSFISG